LVAEKQFDQEFRIFDKSRFTLLQSSVKQWVIQNSKY
jgi:hypothetical protein